MMKAVFYSFLVCFIAWCQATNDDSFGYASNITDNLKCVVVNKRNESHCSAPLGLNQTRKPCVVTFKDSDISAILELAKIKTTNIIDIDIKFQSNTRNQKVNKTRWVLTNKLGLEILAVFLFKQSLKMDTLGNLATDALNVGREAAQLAVTQNPPECILEKKLDDFLAVELLERLSFSGIENELCYKTPTDAWYSKCCKIKYFNYDKHGHLCYSRSARTKFVMVLETLFSVVSVLLLLAVIFEFYMVLYLPWQSECRNEWYHELNVSPMSLSSICSMLFWDEWGFIISVVRRMVLVFLVGYLLFLTQWRCSFVVLFSFWVFFILLSLGSNYMNFSAIKIVLKIELISSAVLFNYLLYYLHSVAILSTSGILLNILYLFPYITFMSVLLFYSLTFWRSVEAKYFTLKALIYDEIDNNDGDDDINRSDNGNDSCEDDYEIVCVVSKELYEKIRERLLPYKNYLFYFALKLFFMVGFCYIALSLVKIFQANGVCLYVQILTSLSLSAIPRLLNIVVSRKGDEEKAAWKKQLRVRVKQQVKRLTTRNPEYRKILLKKSLNDKLETELE